MLLSLLLLLLPQFAAIAGGPVRAKGREDRERIIASGKVIIDWKIPTQSGKPATYFFIFKYKIQILLTLARPYFLLSSLGEARAVR